MIPILAALTTAFAVLVLAGAVHSRIKANKEVETFMSLQSQMSLQNQMNALGQAQSFGLLQNTARNSLLANPGIFLGVNQEPIPKPSKDYPNTMGWRVWIWDIKHHELRSPSQGTVWNGPELRCDGWDETDVVRGVAGIHARLVPEDWRKIVAPEAAHLQGTAQLSQHPERGLTATIAVTGIVERFGKYVLGEDGWRAEWVLIRKLAAPTSEIGMALEQQFPDVEVIYGDR